MKINWTLMCCVSSVAIGCGELAPTDDIATPAAVDLTAEGSYADPETGVVYDLNPNRRVVLGEGAPVGTKVRALPGDVTETLSALSASGDDVDGSGRIVVQLVECVSRAHTGNTSIGCSVSADYVLIGGGAADEWTGAGALLWESRSEDFDDLGTGRTWLASAKDHEIAASHSLHVWAIGLRLKRTDGTFLPRAELKSHVFYSRVTSAVAAHPTATCEVSLSRRLLGGGARANWQVTGGAGQLLTRSSFEEWEPWKWVAASKDHDIPNPATIDAQCIAIDTVMPGVGKLGTVYSVSPSPTCEGTGVQSASRSIIPNGRPVIAGYGGVAAGNGAGRLLFRMGPADGDIRAFVASSKDHMVADGGCTTAAGVGLYMLP